MLKCAENSSNPLSLLIFGIEGTRLRIEEAKLMYKQLLSKTEDAIMVIAVILQRMRSTEDALRVLRYFIGRYCKVCMYSICVCMVLVAVVILYYSIVYLLVYIYTLHLDYTLQSLLYQYVCIHQALMYCAGVD